MLWWVISQAYDYVETVLFIVYIIFMLNDLSTYSVVLKAKLQQQMWSPKCAAITGV